MVCELRVEPFLEHASGVWLENWLGLIKNAAWQHSF